MEFRCRLVTAAGEIVEGTYAAESEARLRHDFENQGLHVFSLRKRNALQRNRRLGPRRRKVARHEFLVFNQEFATLLKAGMPLVQSIDLLRHQVVESRSSMASSTMSTRRCAEAPRCPTRLANMAICFRGSTRRRCWRESEAATSTRSSRRYVAYEKVVDTVRRKTISALIYPVILIVLAIFLVGIIVLASVVPAFSDFYASFDAELPVSTRIILGVSNLAQPQFGLLIAALALGAPRSPPGSASRASARDSITRARPCRWSARPCASSRQRRWRERWRRCSAAVFRW